MVRYILYIKQQGIMLLTFNRNGQIYPYIKQHVIMLLTFNRNGQIYPYIKQHVIMLLTEVQAHLLSDIHQGTGTTLLHRCGLLTRRQPITSACFNLLNLSKRLFFRRHDVLLHRITANHILQDSLRAVFHCFTICEGFVFFLCPRVHAPRREAEPPDVFS